MACAKISKEKTVSLLKLFQIWKKSCLEDTNNGSLDWKISAAVVSVRLLCLILEKLNQDRKQGRDIAMSGHNHKKI